MEQNSSQSVPKPVRSGTWWLGQIILFLFLWLTLIQLPSPPSVGLDNSWQMVLSYAKSHDLQHGSDIVFTYGPLGYLMATTYTGDHINHYIIWQLCSSLFIAAVLYAFGRSFAGWRKITYFGFLLLIGCSYIDVTVMIIVTIFGAMLMRKEYQRPVWIVSLSLALSVYALIKFTNTLLGSFIVVVVASYYLLNHKKTSAVLLVATYCGVFLGGWLAYGQNIALIPSFFRYGWELSSGYSSAMAAYETPQTFWIGLGGIFCVGAYCAAYFFSSSDRIKAATCVAIVGATAFLNWKHGFVRADGHVFAHYVLSLMIVSTYPALLQDEKKWPRVKGIFLIAGCGFCLTGIYFFRPNAVIQAPSDWNYRIRDTLSVLTHPTIYRQELDQKFHSAKAAADLPMMKTIIGHETVDHLGYDQAYTILNDFNYTPRPVVQSYIAYTDRLNRLDNAFYLSERGPQFVIHRFRSIDERLIAQDDSLTLKTLFQNYHYVIEERGLILWERPGLMQPSTVDDEKIILNETIDFDQFVKVPDLGRSPLWVKINVPQNFLGHLREFFYKPPTLWIDTIDIHGVKREFRFIRTIGSTGFILHPFYTNETDIITDQTGESPLRIKSFSIRTMPGGNTYYGKHISVEIRTIRRFTRLVDGLKVTSPRSFRMTNRPPDRITASNPIMDSFDGKEHLLQMQPASAMEFDLAKKNATRVHAEFGLMPGAFAGPGGTYGVVFTVEWRSEQGETQLLFSRLLDPMKNPADRPRQTLDLTLKHTNSGTLIFRTLVGPTGKIDYAWSYWTALNFQ